MIDFRPAPRLPGLQRALAAAETDVEAAVARRAEAAERCERRARRRAAEGAEAERLDGVRARAAEAAAEAGRGQAGCAGLLAEAAAELGAAEAALQRETREVVAAAARVAAAQPALEAAEAEGAPRPTPVAARCAGELARAGARAGRAGAAGWARRRRWRRARRAELDAPRRGAAGAGGGARRGGGGGAVRRRRARPRPRSRPRAFGIFRSRCSARPAPEIRAARAGGVSGAVGRAGWDLHAAAAPLALHRERVLLHVLDQALLLTAGAKALPSPCLAPQLRLTAPPAPLRPSPATDACGARRVGGRPSGKRKVAPFRKRGMWYGFDALAWYRKERGVKRCLPPPAPPRAPPGAPSCLTERRSPTPFGTGSGCGGPRGSGRCELRAVVAEPRAASPAAGSRARPDRGAEERGFGRTSSTPGRLRARALAAWLRARRSASDSLEQAERVMANFVRMSCPRLGRRAPRPCSPRLPPMRLLPPCARRRGGGAGWWAQVLCLQDGGGVLGVAARGRVRAVCARLPPRAAVGAGVGRVARALCRHAGAVH